MELVLPQNYVEIEQEEMEYLDGSYRASKQVWFPGKTIKMTRTQYEKENGLKNAALGALLSFLGPLGTVLGISKSFLEGINPKSKADEYDMADGKMDGNLLIKIPGSYQTIYNPFPPHSYEGARW